MPTYNFRDINSGEETEVTMRISELDEYKKNNPHLQQFLTKPPGLGDSVRMGFTKPDNGFKEVLSKIHEKTPGSTLNRDIDF